MSLPLGNRVFSVADQQRFAEMSGDRNPMHLDPAAARRLLTGAPIVHGVHVLLAALEHQPNAADVHPESLRCTFENPVSVGEQVHFTHSEDRRGRIVIDAAVKNVRCARVVITLPAAAMPGEDTSRMAPAADVGIRDLEPATEPLNEAPDWHVGKRYRLRLRDGGLCREFPSACRLVGAHRVAAVASLSYFAGMICPGLHSVLSSITIDFTGYDASDASLIVSVRNYHANVRLFDIAFEGAMHGRLEAFLRTPPQRQASLDELSTAIRADEFRGTHSLVVGGSRGLGELTAKMIAAGGGRVDVTYHSGGDDAARVSDEINSRHPGACRALKFDVVNDSWDGLAIADNLNAAYYFPTPRIFRKSAGVFDAERFQEFAKFYIDAFYALCVDLERRATQPVRVFFPSSVAVAERPKGLTEYAMAKAAAEIAIDDINRAFKRVSVMSRRLPRLSTDQTASLLDVPAESNIATLVPIIREMYR